MSNSIKERISALVRFQQVELDIARARERLDAIGPRLEALGQRTSCLRAGHRRTARSASST